jgi:hypothetical protein
MVIEPLVFYSFSDYCKSNSFARRIKTSRDTRAKRPRSSHSDRLRQLADARRSHSVRTSPSGDGCDSRPPAAGSAWSIRFPEADLHFLIHDIGAQEALPIIALASNRQWEYLLDMEVWNKDQLDYQQTATWIQLLLKADPERLVRWCFDEKLEFLEMVLFRNIELRVREADQVPSDFGDGFFTDDDTFYIRFVDYPVVTKEEETIKRRRDEMLTQLLHKLSVYDHPRYQGLLMEAVSVIPGETEEELFRMRNVRLGEKGFLPFYEAVGVYQPLRPGDLDARGRKKIHPPAPAGSRFPVPQFAAIFLEGTTFSCAP